MDTWIPIVDVEAEVALQTAAAAEGVTLPAPVRSRAGAVVESIGGHDWRVYPWLHSGPPLAAPVSSAITRTVGGILAKIHQLGLPVDRISPWHRSRLSRVSWPELAATAGAGGAGWADALTEAVPALVDLDTMGEAAPTAAPVLCHNALGPANVRLGADRRVIVSGWEHAGGQPPHWELGDALVNWTADPVRGVNADGARAMLEGYRSVAGSLPPLDMSMFSGAATSLANYLFGEVQQALNTTDGEHRRYADRSVRHLLSHLKTRSTFERLLDVTVARSA
jgi:Ser/Thr protein kinase RdoA (MazF antagonist)